MSENSGNKLKRILLNLIPSGNPDGRSANLIDVEDLNDQQKKDLAADLLMTQLSESSCYCCGGGFSSDDLETARDIGPMGGHGFFRTHGKCFKERVEEVPEIQTIINNGKPFGKLSPFERKKWEEAFSLAPKNSKIRKFFTGD